MCFVFSLIKATRDPAVFPVLAALYPKAANKVASSSYEKSLGRLMNLLRSFSWRLTMMIPERGQKCNYKIVAELRSSSASH